MKNNLDYTLLHLSLISGVGPATIERLTQNLTLEQLAQLYNFTKSDCVTLLGLSETLAEKIVTGLAHKDLLTKELELIDKYDINWATLLCTATYPVALKTIHLAPTVLYWRGQLESSDHKTVACVGSRNSNKYGSDVIDHILPELLHDNWVTVSGGAIGIDTLVHKKTVQENGKTYAILGSGLLRPYPASNITLFKDIVASGGAVISSFALQQEPIAGNFPSRNRIIAGLSKVCLIIQAAEKSGALITARYALEQGREVCAVPGSIFDPLAQGCNQLISQGATPISYAEDILHALGYVHERKNSSADNVNKYEQKTIMGETTLSQKIISFCAGPRSTDELLAQLTCTELELHDELFALQLSGAVEQNFMGLWQKSH